MSPVKKIFCISVYVQKIKYHYIYKITCLCGSLKNHYYIGKRTTKTEVIDPLHDGYYGSGTKLVCYYKKYKPVQGETIIKEILEFNNTREENAEREKNWIGDKWETDPLCLNLKPGGNGGVVATKEIRKKISNSNKGRIAWNKGIKMTEEQRKKNSKCHIGQVPWNKGIKGVVKCGPCSEEKKRNISNAKKGICTEKMRKAADVFMIPIVEITKEGKVIDWASATTVEKNGGPNHSAITAVCNHKYGRKTAGGSKWMYADEYYEQKKRAI